MPVTLEDLFTARTAGEPLTEVQLADKSAAMSRRRIDEVHACVFCGSRARAAVIGEASTIFPVPCWLDMCWRDYDGILRLGLGVIVTDFEIMERYRRWTAGGDRPWPISSSARTNWPR